MPSSEAHSTTAVEPQSANGLHPQSITPPPVAIEVTGVTKRYRRSVSRKLSLKERTIDWILRRNDQQHVEFDALRDVTFRIPAGQTVGVIGRNGAGKSTLLRLLAGIAEPDAGRVQVSGRIGTLLELGAGFAPELTGRRNVSLYGALLGMTRREIDARLPSIVEFSGVADFLDTPVKHYSSGMFLRLAFSIAAHMEPDVLLLDEVLAVGDSAFQQKCLARMRDLHDRKTTIVLVSHNLLPIVEICDRVLLIDHASVVADGDPSAVLSAYAAAALVV